MATKATKSRKKNFDAPDEVRSFPHGRMDLVNVGEAAIGRMTFEPGWRWTQDMPAVAGTPTCRTHHLGMVTCGILRIRMDDGTELEAGPGDVLEVLPGHDAWVVGDEPVEWVEFAGARHYAEAEHDHQARPATVTLLPEPFAGEAAAAVPTPSEAAIRADAGPTAGPPPAEGPEAAFRHFTHHLNARRFEDLGHVLAPGMIDHDRWPGQASGADGFRRALIELIEAMPDAVFEPEEVLEVGDRVAYTMALTGTHQGALMGIPPTGRSVRVRGTGMVRVVGGRITDSWGGPDVGSLLDQLGAGPWNQEPAPVKGPDYGLL